MSWEDATRFWLSVASFFLSIIVGIYTWIATRRKNVDRKLTEHDRRIQKVEDNLHHLPQAHEVHSILVTLETMRGEMRVLAQSLQGQEQIMARIEAMVSRHEDTLLGRGTNGSR